MAGVTMISPHMLSGILWILLKRKRIVWNNFEGGGGGVTAGLKLINYGCYETRFFFLYQYE